MHDLWARWVHGSNFLIEVVLEVAASSTIYLSALEA
jgi:hypothetical protein